MLGSTSLKVQIVVIGFVGILLFYGGVEYQAHRLNTLNLETTLVIEEKEEVKEEEKTKPMLIIHVVGAVENPGVYTLEEGKRVNDAITLAIPTEKADVSLINLAALLQDGQQIYVPKKGEEVSKTTTYKVGLININTAGVNELDTLSGIGPALAERIIEYREKHGPFKSIDELTKVSGIGPVLLEKIRSKVTI